MSFQWAPEHTLLLNFRNAYRTAADPENLDDLGRFSSLSRHRGAAKRFSNPLPGVWVPCNGEMQPDSRAAFAWGWWRKGWEQHDECLGSIDDYLRNVLEGGQPRTIRCILYSPADNEMHSAEVLSVYFKPLATFVGLHPDWRNACPDYYREDQHLCGAFFLIDANSIETVADPDQELSQYVVVPQTFAELPSEKAGENGAEVPHGSTRQFFSAISWGQPDRARLRATEKTLWVLHRGDPFAAWEQRVVQHGEGGAGLGDELLEAFPARDRSDALSKLRRGGRRLWTALGEQSPVFAEAVGLAGEPQEFVSRLDMALVSQWLGRNANIGADSPGQLDERPLDIHLIDWATEADYDRKARIAKEIFSEAWRSFSSRYEVADDTEKRVAEYLENLPNFEWLLTATQHGLRGKTYRDHLNHNVRTALLTPFLAEKLGLGDHTPNGVDNVTVWFFAGLLHDIAYMLSEAERAFGDVQSAMKSLPVFGDGGGTLVPLNTDILQSLSMLVVTLGACPDLETKLGADADRLRLDESTAELRNDGLPDVQRDLMFCMQARGHAILGAISVLALACGLQRGDTETESTEKITGFFNRVCLDGCPHREILLICQAIALHDRKDAAKFAGSADDISTFPSPLSFDQQPTAFAVALADELQDWGRPIGARRMCAVLDSDIDVDADGNVSVTYQLSPEAEAFAGTDYSLIEHAVGKALSLSNLVREVPFACKVSLAVADGRPFLISAMRAQASGVVKPSKQANDTLEQASMSNGRSPVREVTVGSADTMLAFRREDEQVYRDLVLLRNGLPGSGVDAVSRLRRATFERSAVRFEFTSGAVVELAQPKYAVGPPSEGLVSVLTRDGLPGKIRVLDGAPPAFTEPAEPEEQRATNSLRSAPEAHFLDLDWRFSEETCGVVYGILQQIAGETVGRTARICYLGCPSLAVWHAVCNQDDGDSQYALLDRGHPGIEYWSANGVIPANAVSRYDVGDELPPDCVGAFDIVVMDPPWYEEYYGWFLLRGHQLLREDGGWVALAEYPGYDRDKAALLQRMRRDFGLGDPVFSRRISYSIPHFERFVPDAKRLWAGERYRPADMDFYRIDAPVLDRPRPGRRPPSADLSTVAFEGITVKYNPRHVEDGGHALRQETGPDLQVYRYTSLKRPSSRQLADMVAWSSSNVVVRKRPTGFPQYEVIHESVAAGQDLIEFVARITD